MQSTATTGSTTNAKSRPGTSLGAGVLSWTSFERQCDRYGAVHLNYGLPDAVSFDAAPIGIHGRLSAIIIETRPSIHRGDLVRGQAPSGTGAGEEIVLGEGELFTEPLGEKDALTIGVKPADGRADDWMAPSALYQCHNQVVRLIFTPLC
ncbi:hypothetical protein [Streptomyces sp. S1D4-20]|uniref:hypothetical protein n=1 Tax=Streptomyces sp. S1D4-20 TaxID=2594462 RepID=UPI00116423F9|nr:hypothetical protein [Streptomyces sp. S1D4-20]QDN54281.1 hypothetical protein FNV67_01600 [Streptomyces sp. S1D4-20]